MARFHNAPMSLQRVPCRPMRRCWPRNARPTPFRMARATAAGGGGVLRGGWSGLMLLALVTHRAADPGFSTSGHRRAGAQQGGPARRLGVRPGLLPVRLFGLVAGCWSGCAPGWPRWRDGLRGATDNRLPNATALAGSGSAWCCCWRPAAALEWTRLYRWEAACRGQAGGVLGAVGGGAVDALAGLCRLGRAVDRAARRWCGVVAAFLVGACGRAHRASGIEGLRSAARPSASSAKEDLRIGEQARASASRWSRSSARSSKIMRRWSSSPP